MHISLGNAAPLEVIDGERRALPVPDGGAVTSMTFAEGTSLGEAFTAVTAANGVWASHSDADPAWVSSDNKNLAALVADHYGCDTQPHPES